MLSKDEPRRIAANIAKPAKALLLFGIGLGAGASRLRERQIMLEFFERHFGQGRRVVDTTLRQFNDIERVRERTFRFHSSLG
jgi:hypothetical protein